MLAVANGAKAKMEDTSINWNKIQNNNDIDDITIDAIMNSADRMEKLVISAVNKGYLFKLIALRINRF